MSIPKQAAVPTVTQYRHRDTKPYRPGAPRGLTRAKNHYSVLFSSSPLLFSSSTSPSSHPFSSLKSSKKTTLNRKPMLSPANQWNQPSKTKTESHSPKTTTHQKKMTSLSVKHLTPGHKAAPNPPYQTCSRNHRRHHHR